MLFNIDNFLRKFFEVQQRNLQYLLSTFEIGFH